MSDARNFTRQAQRSANDQQMANRGYDVARITSVNGDGTYQINILGRQTPSGGAADTNWVTSQSGNLKFNVGDYVLVARMQGSNQRLTIVGLSPWKCSGTTITVYHNVG